MDKKLPINIDFESVIVSLMKTPAIKVDRSKFLRKELQILYSRNIVNDAIKYSPAQAGISKEEIDTIAKQIINYETNKVSAISFAAGIPGGIAMVATIPADITQYFSFILIVMQKLAYLYGFEEFDLKEDSINDNTLNEIMLFLGVMFGVNGANVALKKTIEAFCKQLEKNIVKKPLTKGVVYPFIKKIFTKKLGEKMTKTIFAESIGKLVGFGLGGIISGGITYASFKPCCYRLMNEFRELPLADINTYKEIEA